MTARSVMKQRCRRGEAPSLKQNYNQPIHLKGINQSHWKPMNWVRKMIHCYKQNSKCHHIHFTATTQILVLLLMMIKKMKDRPLCLLNLDLKSSCSMQGMRAWQRWDKVIALQVRISLRSWLLRCQIPNQDQHVPCPSTKLFVFSHHHALFATF